MEIRRTPLPGPVEYILDSATESGEIDHCTSSTLRLFGDPILLENIVGPPLTEAQARNLITNVLAGRCNHDKRRAIRNAMVTHADVLLPQLDLPIRGALIHDGLRGINFVIGTTCEFLADCALTDAVEGGSLEPFKHGREIRLAHTGYPYKRLLRRLCSPSYIRRYVKRTDQLEALRGSTDTLLRRARAIPQSFLRADDDDNGIWVALDYQLAAFREHRLQQLTAEERLFWSADTRPIMLDEKRRKLLKRAAVIASGVIGVQAVGALSRGEKIKIDGPTLSIQMQKRGLLTDRGHGVLDVSMLDHAGTRLADLCIYQDSVPAIDQAVGFALMVQSGMEKELLEEGNITALTPAGEANEVILARQRKNVVAMANEGFRQVINSLDQPLRVSGKSVRRRISGRRWTYEDGKTWKEFYWAKTKGIWRNTVRAAVFGRNLKFVQRII